ncbi:MAG: hypothetical protein AB8B87_10385 [Granulosicoccus sp.]
MTNRHLPAFPLLLCLAISLISCSDKPPEQQDIQKLIAEMEQRTIATTTTDKRGSLIPRYNQPKTIACLTGEFTVSDNLPDNLRHGLFAEPASYPVTARFANASKWDDSEKDIRGMSIRVSNVPGETIWGDAGKQDFLLNSYPALFVATPEDFLGFMQARQAGGTFSLIKFFLNPFDPHLKSLLTVLKARDKHRSPLDIQYWSTVPSALDGGILAGDSIPDTTTAVKYSLIPCSTYRTDDVVNPGENQLRSALMAHLEQAPACFEFAVQRQSNPDTMPIEDASVIWDEDESPFQTVATLRFNKQAADDVAALASCESSQFNPWQSLAAHTPLGRMNAVRQQVYAKGAQHRANP